MTEARTKKIKEALNGLIEHILNSYLIQDINMLELSIQDRQWFVNVIQDSKSDLE